MEKRHTFMRLIQSPQFPDSDDRVLRVAFVGKPERSFHHCDVSYPYLREIPENYEAVMYNRR